VSLDDSVNDGQTQTGSLGPGGEEWIEDAIQSVGGDARSVVAYFDLDAAWAPGVFTVGRRIGLLPGRDPNVPATIGGLNAVQHQVDQHLPQAVLITEDLNC
jgi:hypothetical protein